MADISSLARLVSGYNRNVDITSNTLVTLSVKVGGSVSNTELTKAILDRLVSLQNGTDVDTTYHTHDTVYTRTSALASTTGGSAGSKLIGDDNSYTNFTPGTATVKGALQAIDSVLGSASNALDGTFRIKNSTDQTKKIAFDASAISTATTRTISMPDANVNLGLIATALQTSQLGAASGVASLDSGGKVPLAQLPNGVFIYKGTWDPTSNTPTLADGTGTQGWVYWVSAASAGPISGLNNASMVNFQIGDLVIYNGSQWELTTPAAGVQSVNGSTGAVTVNAINQLTGDVTAGPASGSQSKAATIAAGAVTPGKLGTVTDGSTLDQSGSGSTLRVKPAGVGATQLATSAADQATILGGAGTALNVAYAPAIKIPATSAIAMTANTTYAVRFAIPSNSETAGRVYAADNNAASANNFFAVGLVSSTSSVSIGGSVVVQTEGIYTLGSSDTPFTTPQIGLPVWVGSSGALTTTAPSSSNLASYMVGIVVSTTQIFICKQLMGIN